jgi:hypothetical protein
MKVESAEELAVLKQFDSDSAWLQSNLKRLIEDYKNKYVLVQNKKIAADGDSFEDIEKQAERLKINLTTSVVEFIPSKFVTVLF